MLSSTKLSWCPIHGEDHALASGLCTDPDCVAKIITTYTKTWKSIARYWRRIVAGRLKYDFCVFVVEQLMKEEKQQGKKPTLNPKWLIFRMKQYLYKDARFSDVSESDIPKFAKSKIQAGQIYYEDLKSKFEEEGTSHILDSIINEGYAKMGRSDLPNPEIIVLFTELKHHIVKNYGEPWFLYEIDAITIADLSKLVGMSLKEVMKTWETIRKQIQVEYMEKEIPI